MSYTQSYTVTTFSVATFDEALDLAKQWSSDDHERYAVRGNSGSHEPFTIVKVLDDVDVYPDPPADLFVNDPEYIASQYENETVSPSEYAWF